MVYSEHSYAGMDFRGDPDLVLPAGEQWGAIGKFFDHIHVYRFSFIMSLCFILSTLNQTHVFMQMLVPFGQ